MSARAHAATFACAFRERLRYPGEALGFAVFLPMVLFIFTSLWRATARVHAPGRYTVSDLVLYLLVTEIVTMSPGWMHQAVSASVRSGDVSMELLRPVHWVPAQLARAAGAACARMLLLGAAGSAALVLLVGVPRLDARGLAAAAVLVPAAILVDCAARLLVGLMAFWFEESAPFYWIWQKLAFVLGGLMLPLDFYPGWLRTAAGFLPFASMLYGPAHQVVAFDLREAAAVGARLVAWLAVMVLLLVLAFGRAARRIQHNGG